MKPVKRDCAACRGAGMIWPPPAGVPWQRCAACDGLGREWVEGAPRFGCDIALAERIEGEIVELGTGDVVRVLWHSDPRVDVAVTAVGEVDPFTDEESHDPVLIPSAVGVRAVIEQRHAKDRKGRRAARVADVNDPMQRENR